MLPLQNQTSLMQVKLSVNLYRLLRILIGKQLPWWSGWSRHLVTCWCDSDWAACPNTRRSITGYAIKFGESFVSWKFKKQHTVSRSSAEAEYRSISSATAEVTWLLGLFSELEVPIPLPVTLMSDCKSAIQLAASPVFRERAKHIEIDCHFISTHSTPGC